MSTQDDELASDPSHRIAMDIQAIMGGISDLYDVPTKFLNSDLTDLELAHARLGYLLGSLRKQREA